LALANRGVPCFALIARRYSLTGSGHPNRRRGQARQLRQTERWASRQATTGGRTA